MTKNWPNAAEFPADLLQCPSCASGAEADFAADTLVCSFCQTPHFYLGSVPCLFPAGLHHKSIWQHQAAMIRTQGEQGLAQVQEAMSRYDLTAQTRERMAESFAALQASQQATLSLLAGVGVEAKLNEQMGQMNPGDLAEYYDLILRDWAWQSSENSDALARVLFNLPDAAQPRRILVLGAGAGRLSWDVHCALRPQCTIALDSNPLLLAVAERLIKQRNGIELAECKTFPQINRQSTRSWNLQPPHDPERLRDSWFALGANAWRAPLKLGAFDLIITPWFIDVNGGDVRDTIAVVSRLLASGGHWLNTGPLLFTRHLPLQLKYEAQEIKEFLALSGFTIKSETVDEDDHLDSPLEVRKQHEQLWTFCAQKSQQSVPAQSLPGQAPAWLIMHHLPVPQHAYATQQEHPIIDAILALIDGKRSINDITVEIAPRMPEGVSAKDAVVTLLGQILREMDE